MESQRMWVVDLDKTLLDTHKFFEYTAEISRSLGITGGKDLYRALESVEDTGGSFDTDEFLKLAGASEAERAELWGTVGLNEGNAQFLYPDAVEFLAAIDELGYPYATLTLGSIATQIPKLRATVLDRRPYIITDVKEKGELIQKWKGPEGYRAVTAAGQILVAESGVLVDDKARSFDGLPGDWSGYLVRRDIPKLSQMGSVPESVSITPNLSVLVSNVVKTTR